MESQLQVTATADCLASAAFGLRSRQNQRSASVNLPKDLACPIRASS